MLRFLSKEFLVAVILSFSVAIIALSVGGPPYPNQDRPHVQAQQEPHGALKGEYNPNKTPSATIKERSRVKAHDGGDETSEFWTIFGRKVKITDTLLVLFAFLLWIATRDLVRGSDRTAKRQLRAYITVESGGVTLILREKDALMSPIIKLKNVGQTPAYEFQTWIEAWVRPLKWSGAFALAPPARDRGDARSIVGPQQDANIGEPFAISLEDFTAIRSRSKAIYIWGRADYVDIFGGTRYFIFKYQMSGLESVTPVNGTMIHSWALCPDSSGFETNDQKA